MKLKKEIFLYLFFLLFSICSCNRNYKEEVLSYKNEKIIKEVKALKWFEEEQKIKALQILDEAIENNPDVWSFYSYKISVSTANRQTREDYETANQVILECMERYISNNKNEFTPYQDYLYGFALMCSGQKDKAEKYLNDGYKYVLSLKRKPKHGSRNEFEMGNSLMCGFVLGKIDFVQLSEFKPLFADELVYEGFEYLINTITPEEYINNYGKM